MLHVTEVGLDALVRKMAAATCYYSKEPVSLSGQFVLDRTAMLATIESYAALGVTILLVVGMVAAMLVIAHTVGPRRRHGPVKDMAYESGMPPIGGTHQRFNIRFYIVAMLFLLFDVELIMIYPWAQAFYESATLGTVRRVGGELLVGKGFLLGSMGLFFAMLVFGLVYEWKKGAFQWE